jgi:TetR/AcrR family transcriptional regulator, fatty acid metabolism regulator protein
VVRRQHASTADRASASREAILDGAFETFTRNGYRDTAIDDIAAAADISKGGIYFHFPNKESIFRELMRTTADKLVDKVERAVEAEPDPIRKAEIALRTVLEVFAGHRTMARLFFEAGGAGRGFQAELNVMHERFARLIQSYLDEAVADGTIPPIDTRITSVAWFGALDEVVDRWLQASHPGRLEDAYPTLRAILLRSAGVPESRIAVAAEVRPWPGFPEAAR